MTARAKQKRELEKQEHDKALTKFREMREAKEQAEAKAAEDAKRKKDEANNKKAAEDARQKKENAEFYGPNGKLARSLDEKYKCWMEAKKKNVALPAEHPDKAAAE